MFYPGQNLGNFFLDICHRFLYYEASRIASNQVEQSTHQYTLKGHTSVLRLPFYVIKPRV